MSYQRAASFSSVIGKIFIMVSAVETLFARLTLPNRLKCVLGHSSEPPRKIGNGAMLTYKEVSGRLLLLLFGALDAEFEDGVVFLLEFVLFSEADVVGAPEENRLGATGSESDAESEA